MLSVHVRITDAATGKPTPVRLRLVDSTGLYHAPLGRLDYFATEPDRHVGGNLLLVDSQFAYIDGTCEVNIPPGSITVEVSKGPEYLPIKQTIELVPGKLSMRLTIERWIDLRKEGWYSADTRALYLPPHEALLEAGAEDLAIVNLLALETPNFGPTPSATPNLLAFSGGKPALEMPGHQVVVNTLNVHPVLGTVALLNCHRVVYPLRFGGSEQDDAWSICDWCDQCHRRKSGLVVWPDLPRLRDDALQGEALAAVLLDKIDVFEISYFDAPSAALADWYRLLDCGLCLPLVCGSGKESNAVALGAVRTYAHLIGEEPLSFTAWTDAVRAGRTFVTNGPLLTLTVEGQEPGAILHQAEARKSLHFRAEARSAIPFDRIEVVHKGKVIASKETEGDRRHVVLEDEFCPLECGWIAARCSSADLLLDGQIVFAHTSPIYIDNAIHPHRSTKRTIEPLTEILDKTLTWVKETARMPSEKPREHLVGLLESARMKLVK